MQMTDRIVNRYGAVAQTLHWVVAVLIVVQFYLAVKADDLPIGMEKLSLLARHKSVGMTVFMLAVFRVIWRFTHPVPPLPASMPRHERVLAHASHWLLYF